jgi:hypothetical protein
MNEDRWAGAKDLLALLAVLVGLIVVAGLVIAVLVWWSL